MRSAADAPAVRRERDGDVLKLVIENEERANALSSEIVVGLREGLRAAERDHGVGCVLISSAGGRAFSAGADLALLHDGGRMLREIDFFGLFEEIERLSKPVVTAVQGVAVGGGFELCLVADLVVASTRATFGLPETTIGVAPGIAMVRLHQLVGRHLTKALAWTGRRLDAEEAYRLGIVARLCEPEALDAGAAETAHEIARRAPLAVRLVKRAVNRSLVPEDWELVREGTDTILRSDDLQEGLLAWQEKRVPRFSCR